MWRIVHGAALILPVLHTYTHTHTHTHTRTRTHTIQEGNLSAVDILSVASLVNYFGKATNIESIEVSPLLLQVTVPASLGRDVSFPLAGGRSFLLLQETGCSSSCRRQVVPSVLVYILSFQHKTLTTYSLLIYSKSHLCLLSY